MATENTETRIGIIINSKRQVPLAQEIAVLFCRKYNLSDKYLYDLQLVIEEFLVSLYDSIGADKEVSFYISFTEKAARIIFNIAGTGFDPAISDFSPMEFAEDEATHFMLGLTVIKRMVDAIKHIKEGDKNEVHFIMYIGHEDFKDAYGFRRRYPIFNKKDAKMSEIETKEGHKYNLRLEGSDKYFSVTDREYFIIQMLDGKHGIKDIVEAFNKKYGEISPRSVNHFIDTLEEKDFIKPEFDFAFAADYKKEGVKISLLEKILALQYSIPHVDKIVTAVYKRLKWVLSPLPVFIILASIVALYYEVFHNYAVLHVGRTLKAYANNPSIILIYYSVMLCTVVCHEFAHALVCKKYGGQVNKMGLMIYYFQVCAYADTSDAWLFKEKYKRILTSLSGPLTNAFMASIFLWGYYTLTPITSGDVSLIHSHLASVGSFLGLHNLAFFGIVRDLLIMAAAANFLTSFLNLIPFIELDGYYILADIVDSPNIRMLSMGYVINPIRMLFNKDPYPIHPSTWWKKMGYIIFGIACLGYGILAFSIVFYFFTFRYKTTFHSVFGIFVAVSLVLYTLKTFFLKKIQKKREFLQRKVISY